VAEEPTPDKKQPSVAAAGGHTGALR